MARISVCMATYNGEQFVNEQIQSILLQLREDDELIISDDSSTDNTLSIIAQFNDNRIRLFSNQLLRSTTYNFENALRHATGDVIFLSDQDDLWFDNKLEFLLPYLQHYDLVVSDCVFIDEHGKHLGGSFFKHFNSGPGLIKNFIKNTFLGNCMAFRRSVLDRALPFPKELHKATRYHIYQDVWLGLIASSVFRVAFVEEQLSGFRRHGNNASPTEMAAKSPQSLIRKFLGRSLLTLALLKRILKIA